MDGADDPVVPAKEVREELARICASDSLIQVDRLKVLLTHIVEETLSGRTENLLGKNIAVDVFGADPEKKEDLSTVRVEIGRLRRRLHRYYSGEGADNPLRIDIPKGGYVATFEPVHPRAQNNPVTLDGDLSESERRAWWQYLAALVAVVALIVVLAIVWHWMNNSPTSDAPGIPRLAVATIDNLSTEPGDELIAKGLTTDTINRLVRFDHMVVVSRRATVKAEAKARDATDIGQTTLADYTLSGTLRREGKTLFVNLELIAGTSGQIVWAGDYRITPNGKNVVRELDGVANAIARELAGHGQAVLNAAPISNNDPASASAYICFLNLYAYHLSPSEEAHWDVRECLEDAVDAHPEYGNAWSGLAHIYLDELRNGYNRRSGYDPLQRAYEAARQGISLSPDSSVGYRAMVAVQLLQGDIEGLHRSAPLGLSLNPNDVDLLAYYGHVLTITGHWDEGQEVMDRAKEMSPVHPPQWHFSSSMNAFRLGDLETALAEAKTAAVRQLYLSYVFLAAIHGHLGNRAEASDAFDSLYQLRPDYLTTAQEDLSKRSIPDDVVNLFLAGLNKAAKIRELD